MVMIKNELFYAPNVRFADLDLLGNSLPDQSEARLRGYYLVPAIEACKSGHAFAAGLILVSCIDAVARTRSGNAKVGCRFRTWCHQELPSFGDHEISNRSSAGAGFC